MSGEIDDIIAAEPYFEALLDTLGNAAIYYHSEGSSANLASYLKARIAIIAAWNRRAPDDAAAYTRGAEEMRERAAKFIDRRREDYIAEHGNYDYSTGVTEFPGNGDETVGEWEELAEAIRALPISPPGEPPAGDTKAREV